MRYNSKEVTNLLAESEGNWEIIAGVDTQRQRDGADQMKLTIKGWDKNGKQGVMYAYISEPWQLKKLCESANKMDLFNRDEINAVDTVGWAGKCIFKTEISDNPAYDDKTVIGRWLKHDGAATKAPAKVEEPMHDDDIPF